MTKSRPTEQQRLESRSRPAGAPVMYQRWRDLVFLHWEWDADEIQATLPPGLHVDGYEGRGFLGIVPFKMRRIRPRFLPPVPGLSDFLELNLRTYVHDEAGLPGVWFYSLDANQRIAVAIARRFFHLPYFWAKMESYDDDDSLHYACSRGDDPDARCSYRCRGQGALRQAPAGSLEFFLLERYVLFASSPGGLRFGRVHHRPYTVRDVEVLDWSERLFGLDGFGEPGRAPDHAVASPGVDVSVYSTRPVERTAEREDLRQSAAPGRSIDREGER